MVKQKLPYKLKEYFKGYIDTNEHGFFIAYSNNGKKLSSYHIDPKGCKSLSELQLNINEALKELGYKLPFITKFSPKGKTFIVYQLIWNKTC